MTTRRDGLSTANFVSGAMQGFQFGENIKDRNAHRERQKKMDGLREAEARRAEERFHMNKEVHANNLKLSESQEQRAAETHGMNKRLNGIRVDQLNQQNLEKMNRGMAMSFLAMQGNDLPPEDAAFLNTHKNLDVRRLLSPEYGKAIETVEKVFAGEIDRNSPEAMEALAMTAPEIMDGTDANVRPAAVLPGGSPNTFRVGLKVEGDDNIQGLTESRSSDDKDPVKEIPVDAYIQRIQTAKMIREKFQNPEFVQAYVKRWAPDALQQGAGSDAPADIRTAKILQQEYWEQDGVKLSWDEAWTKSKMAVTDPTKYVSDYVESRLEAQQYKKKEERKTPEQLEQAGIESLRRIQRAAVSSARDRSSGGAPSGDSQGEPQAQGADQFDSKSLFNEIMGTQSNQTTEPGTAPAQNPRDQAGRRLEEAPTQPGAAPADQASQDAFFGRRRTQRSDVDQFGRPNVF